MQDYICSPMTILLAAICKNILGIRYKLKELSEWSHRPDTLSQKGNSCRTFGVAFTQMEVKHLESVLIKQHVESDNCSQM